jgi:hypothetical protein
MEPFHLGRLGGGFAAAGSMKEKSTHDLRAAMFELEVAPVISLIRSPKDFWSGLIYVAIALFGLVVGREYSMGTPGRMGPAYFPIVIASLLLIFGIVTIARAFLVPGEMVGKIAFKPVLLVVGSVALFGLLVERAGFVIALLLTMLLSASASREFRVDWKATVGLAAFITVAALLFVKALGVPMPLLGIWFHPI